MAATVAKILSLLSWELLEVFLGKAVKLFEIVDGNVGLALITISFESISQLFLGMTVW